MPRQPILPWQKYYNSLGGLVDGILIQVIEQILALPDIPDAESRHLSELCKSLTSLEELFTDEHEV